MKTSTYIFASFIALTSAQWTPDPLCPYPSYEPTRFPYPGDCTKYYVCLGGTKSVETCPDGFEYDAPTQACAPDYQVDCDPDAITTVTWAPTTNGPHCPNLGEDHITYYPYQGDCTMYWECYLGNMYLHQCPVGYQWDQQKTMCDLDENVLCRWEK